VGPGSRQRLFFSNAFCAAPSTVHHGRRRVLRVGLGPPTLSPRSTCPTRGRDSSPRQHQVTLDVYRGPCALRARFAAKHRELTRSDDKVFPGKTASFAVWRAPRLRSQRRGHGFKPRHLHHRGRCRCNHPAERSHDQFAGAYATAVSSGDECKPVRCKPSLTFRARSPLPSALTPVHPATYRRRGRHRWTMSQLNGAVRLSVSSRRQGIVASGIS